LAKLSILSSRCWAKKNLDSFCKGVEAASPEWYLLCWINKVLCVTVGGFWPCNRDWLALNVFLALCYCNLDNNDASLEILDAYLQVCHGHMTSTYSSAHLGRESIPMAFFEWFLLLEWNVLMNVVFVPVSERIPTHQNTYYLDTIAYE